MFVYFYLHRKDFDINTATINATATNHKVDEFILFVLSQIEIIQELKKRIS